jgi:2-polyprenyl-3-methyl-5-hydroxy-6-metoxy-1,4-benzoquinol methylase
MVADLNLTDMETCYKAFRLPLVQSIPLRSNRFGIEPEITIKLAQRQARIYEVPISYHGRTYEEGKKIGIKDAVQALLIILKFGLWRDVYKEPGAAILDSLSQTPRFNRWLASVVAPYLGRRVLELGAGIGNLTMHLARNRKLYIATDIDPDHLGRLRRRFQERPNIHTGKCDLEEAGDFEDLQPAAVDSVICLNVLEHVANDRQALRNIWSVLEPGGRAVILVPEGQSLYGTLDKVLGHFRRYSEEELRSKLNEAGFSVERILRFNRVTRPGWFLNGTVLKRKTFGRFQLWAFDRLVWCWRRVDEWLPWRPVSLIAVAVKPGTSAAPGAIPFGLIRLHSRCERDTPFALHLSPYRNRQPMNRGPEAFRVRQCVIMAVYLTFPVCMVSARCKGGAVFLPGAIVCCVRKNRA